MKTTAAAMAYMTMLANAMRNTALARKAQRLGSGQPRAILRRHEGVSKYTPHQGPREKARRSMTAVVLKMYAHQRATIKAVKARKKDVVATLEANLAKPCPRKRTRKLQTVEA